MMTHIKKVMLIIQKLLAVIIIVLVILHISRAINDAINYAVPLLIIDKCISAFLEWNKDRDLASLDIILAIFIFVVTFAIWFPV